MTHIGGHETAAIGWGGHLAPIAHRFSAASSYLTIEIPAPALAPAPAPAGVPPYFGPVVMRVSGFHA